MIEWINLEKKGLFKFDLKHRLLCGLLGPGRSWCHLTIGGFVCFQEPPDCGIGNWQGLRSISLGGMGMAVVEVEFKKTNSYLEDLWLLM